ncbi:MAG: OadG family protein [Clostridia bacterium]|nr:OadG family protein [Clostridia bacterium]
MRQIQALAYTDVLSLPDTLKTTLIGLLVVFAILAILIGFIELLHALLKDKKSAKQAEPVPNERISSGVLAAVPRAQDAPDDPEFLAAVSAAIASVTGTRQFRIRSIEEKNS